ncbi:Lipopolysaccharide export system protein LptA [compost metagenome]
MRFRQKGDAVDGQEGVWIDGEALRVEIDEKSERIEMHENARITRDKDEVRGNYILYDQRSEFFSVSSAKGAPGSRVTAVIQPSKPKPEAAEAGKPEARKPEAKKPEAKK